MRLRELQSGTQICPEIKLDALLYAHNGIALYLATDTEYKHALVHIIPDLEASSQTKLQEIADFYDSVLNQETRHGQFEEFLYFSEQFPLGEYMFEWLERRERVSIPVALKRVISMLKVLQQAHEHGLYHGRITPQSVLLERSEEIFGLRMMGIGIAQALPDSQQYDIDWFDYTFDLEGMSPVAVDIYGVAIVLMGLVSGESGIDSFESTGLLPQSLRGGIIQQAMERALALRIDSYSNVLYFSQDLEAALLELDERQGEVYVGDLVGFESAVRSISSIEEAPECSGVWSSMFDTLEHEERSSLLCSLTSLSAIKPIDPDEDDDITRVSSTLPQSILNNQRIKSSHAHVSTGDSDDNHSIGQEESNRTVPIQAPSLSDIQQSENELNEALDSAEDSGSPKESSLPPETKEKRASLQSLEAELLGDDSEEEDDAPTRVMMRPNYTTINFGQEDMGVASSIQDVITSAGAGVITATSMENRIRSANVVERISTLVHDVYYDENDPIAFSDDNKSTASVESTAPVEVPVTNSLVRNAATVTQTPQKKADINAPQKSNVLPHTSGQITVPKGLTRTQKSILLASIVFALIGIITLLLTMIINSSAA